MHSVYEGFKHIFVRTEFELLLVAREPWIEVRVIFIQVVNVGKHQNAMIVHQIESVLSIFDVSSFLVKVPLLCWLVTHKLLEIAMDTWESVELLV